MNASLTEPADALAIATLRGLIMDGVEAAKSGHPGAALALAPLGWTLFRHFLRFDPSTPEWPGRDRFVLSCGHASMLQYGLLHLSGYGLELDAIRRFRQLGSPAAGHPEWGHVPGVETTTGPLGQGVANAVGMALAQRHLAARFNREGHTVIDGNIVVIASDGDLMEGITYESSALAGHLRLASLLVFWDDNRITIDGTTDKSTSEDVLARFRAQGWATLDVENGDDLSALRAVIDTASRRDRPTLVRVRTLIGFPAPNKQNSPSAHGAPLGSDEVAATKALMGWKHPPFYVPAEVAEEREQLRSQGRALRAAWAERLRAYRTAFPELAAELCTAFGIDSTGQSSPSKASRSSIHDAVEQASVDSTAPHPLADLAATTAALLDGEGKLATRQSSGKVLAFLAERLPSLVGGSADLAASNNSYLKGQGDFVPTEGPQGSNQGAVPGTVPRNIFWGIREHAMGAACNGMALYGGVRPFAATFLIFSDYMRPAIRLAALMGLPVTYIFTHDSIGVGEDGPTHQPVEQLASLRAIHGLTVLRPADARETAGAWSVALTSPGPVALVLTRQAIGPVNGSAGASVARGAYAVFESNKPLQALLLATGSEVDIAVEAAATLDAEGIGVRVVSMPSWERFEAQPAQYRLSVLPPAVTVRVAIEAATPFGWARYVGEESAVVGMRSFGASGPGSELFAHFGITADAICARVRERLVAATSKASP